VSVPGRLAMGSNNVAKKKPAVPAMPEVSDRLTFDGQVPEPSEVLAINTLGRGLRLLSDTVKDLNLERANEILMLPEFIVNDSEVDRNLRDNHVTYLTACMMRETFHPEWVQIITCVCLEPCGNNPAGAEFRHNGQHTCWARTNMPADYPCRVRFLRYEAQTVADMRILYSSIDRNKSRNNADVLNAHLAGTDQFVGVPKYVVQKIAEAVAFWLWGNLPQGKRHDADDAAFQVQTTYKAQVATVVKFVMASPREHQVHIIRSPVLAAMLETFSKDAVAAEEFWTAVRDGLNLPSREDPRYKLHDALLGSVLLGSASVHLTGKNRVSGKKSTTREEMYRWCVACWNTWRRGGQIRVLRPTLTGVRPVAQ
jgi:hypothetical protein